MALNDNWQIRSRSNQCSATGEAFADGDTVYAAIFRTEGGSDRDFERVDYSAAAWAARKEDAEAPAPFSHWGTTFEAKPDTNTKSEVVEKESAETLLRRLIDEDEAKSENARYILALMLERKKQLIQVDTKPNDDESQMLIYEHAKSGEAFIVRDPLLKLAEIDEIQAEVAGWLGGERPYEPHAHTIWVEALAAS